MAQRDTPIQITFKNNLPSSHIIPVDTTIPGANQAQNRTAVHLHGGLVPWISDGGPFDWWTPSALQSDPVSAGTHGLSFLNNQVLNPGATAGQAEYYYPNNQGSRVAWYHDHAWGITRINAYAGIASAYVITDGYEAALAAPPYNIPGPLDPRTMYLIYQDKIFLSGTNDPGYPVTGAQPGDLWYAYNYDTNRYAPGPGFPPPAGPSVIPEFFGDTILVNGSAYPFVEVEPRQYRLRMLNACNARFLNPKLFFALSNSTSSTLSAEPNMSKPGPAFIQIQTEGGYLPAPAMLNGPGQTRLLLGPAERGDFIVDFRNVPPWALSCCFTATRPGPIPWGMRATTIRPLTLRHPLQNRDTVRIHGRSFSSA